MNIGRLDRQLTLQQLTPAVQNDFGAPDPGTWVDVATVPARVEYKPGTEQAQAQQLTATQRVLFTIRYRAGITADWQLVYEGRTYQITDVAEIGRRRGTLLTCYANG